MTHRVILIRHGTSAQPRSGWTNHAGMVRWREAYDAATIADGPTDDLRASVANCACLAASDMRRAIDSAKALDGDRSIVTSPLVRELSLTPPNLGPIRLPWYAWAIVIALRGLPAHEAERVRAAAAWIEEVAETHKSVALVTHGSFRRELAPALLDRGWKRDASTGVWKNWSAWSLVR